GRRTLCRPGTLVLRPRHDDLGARRPVPGRLPGRPDLGRGGRGVRRDREEGPSTGSGHETRAVSLSKRDPSTAQGTGRLTERGGEGTARAAGGNAAGPRSARAAAPRTGSRRRGRSPRPGRGPVAGRPR